MAELTEQRRARLVELVVAALRTADLPVPIPAEREENYTDRCLAPLLESVVNATEFSGLMALGRQGSLMISCNLLAANFYPDLAIGFYGEPVMAIEVKLLRDAQRQNSIATAIGQGAVYSSRFIKAGVMLIDTKSRLTDQQVIDATAEMDRLGLSLIVRRSSRTEGLRPHPAPPAPVD